MGLKRKYRLEALQPCADVWQQMRPPEWWDDETGEHDGFWEAESPRAVVDAFHKAWPNRHPAAKPYRKFRVTPSTAQRTYRVVEEPEGEWFLFGDVQTSRAA